MISFAVSPTAMISIAQDEDLLVYARAVLREEMQLVDAQNNAQRRQHEQFLQWLHPYIAWRPPFGGTARTIIALRVISIIKPRRDVARANGRTSTSFLYDAIPDGLAVMTVFNRMRDKMQRHYLELAANAFLDWSRGDYSSTSDDHWFVLTSVALPILYRLAAVAGAQSVYSSALAIACHRLAAKIQRFGGGPWLYAKIGDRSERLVAHLTAIINARAQGMIERFAETEAELEADWRSACLPDAEFLFHTPSEPKEEDTDFSRFSRPAPHGMRATKLSVAKQ